LHYEILKAKSMKTETAFTQPLNRLRKESLSRLARAIYCMYEAESEWMSLIYNFLKLTKMKTIKLFYTTIIISALSLTINAQSQSAKEIHLQGSKFLNPLIEQWIAEYSRTHNDVKIVLNTTNDQPADATVQISEDANASGDEIVIYGGRYALLPVANKNNPLLPAINKEGVNKDLLKKIYFEKDIFSEEVASKSDKKWAALSIYTRNAQAATSQVFASYFNDTPTRLRGKKINGDDLFLVSAVRKDTLGLSFNHLNYLFDLQSRSLKEGIAPLPIELGDSRKDRFTVNESVTIDNVLTALQNEPSDVIPVSRFAFRYKAGSANQAQLEAFLKWVATDGQVYNNQFGLLTLDAQTIAQQSKNWNANLFTSR